VGWTKKQVKGRDRGRTRWFKPGGSVKREVRSKRNGHNWGDEKNASGAEKELGGNGKAKFGVSSGERKVGSGGGGCD